MSHTEAVQAVVSLHSPFMVDFQTEAVGERTATPPEDISREALQTQLTKLEEIVEYLKVLYR